MSDLEKVQRRKSELTAKRADLIGFLKNCDAEIEELQIAERVLLRMSGGADVPTPEKVADAGAAEEGRGKPSGLPSVRQMIVEALETARETDGLKGLKPKEITDYIRNVYWSKVPPNQVYTNLSRMVIELGQLTKDDELGIYMLLKEIEPVDDLISRSKSTGSNSDNHTAQGREAVPGGGP